MLAEMSSYELTQWQVFLSWRAEDEKRRRKEREFLKDDDEVTYGM